MNTESRQYLITAFESFDADPADSPYQRGYLSALLAMAQDLAPDIYNMFKGLERQCTRKGAQ